MMATVAKSVFPALLRYWRSNRGMSQLDLAGASDVSPKHISFLETGRAQPSREMVLRLGASLGVPLRDQNALLTGAGFAEVFVEVDPNAFDENIKRALTMMMAHQEPYPLMVMDRHYNLIMANGATRRLLRALLGDRADAETNMMKLVFSAEGVRPYIAEWDKVARTLLIRLQREALARRDDTLNALLAELCNLPDVPTGWRSPDLEQPSEPTLSLRFEFGGQQLGFLTTMSVFQAPQNISLEELQIESYFPLDAATQAVCQALADHDAQSG